MLSRYQLQLLQLFMTYIYIKKIIYKVWLNKIKISRFILNKNNAMNTEIIIINI